MSDNTEATARLAIQEGYSHIFPANTMEAWVTDAGRGSIPLEFRFHVSMCGSLGIGGNLLHWTPEERAQARHWINLYKELRPAIQLGDQYRLLSPQAGSFSAVQYVNKERSEGVLFVFRTHTPEPVIPPLITLRGLDPKARYSLEGFPGARSGESWMQAGVMILLKDFQSTVRRIRKVS